MSKEINKIMARVAAQREPYKRGDIYYIEARGAIIGSEQRAGRPAVIVSNDTANRHSDDVTIVYMTTQPKTDLPTHVYIMSARRPSTALCENVTTVSKERLGEYYGKVTPDEMKAIDEALTVQLALKAELAAVTPDKLPKDVISLTEHNEAIDKPRNDYRQLEKQTEEQEKETDFYKMLYEDALDKMKRSALGGYNETWLKAA